mmetsp:Transcript_22483/g.25806  ORF Transcript_22483/g.25806 Transcript_22483/m.25806 type:complete len:343 (+) Transcript_22483:151-1179(+)
MILPFFINKCSCGRNGTTLFLLLLSLYVIGVVLFGSFLSEGGVEAATNSVRGGRTATTTTTTGKVPSRKLSPVLDVPTTADVATTAADGAADMANVGTEDAAEIGAETELKVQEQQEAEAELRATETIDNEAYEITNEEMQRIQTEIEMVQYELDQAKLMNEEDTVHSNTGLDVEEKETKQLADTAEAEATLYLQELFVHEKEIVNRELKDIDFTQGSGAIEVVVAVDSTDGADTTITTTTTTINIVDPLSTTHKVVEFTGEKAEKLAAHTVINKDDYESEEYNKDEQEDAGEEEEMEHESGPNEGELDVETVGGSDGSDISNNEAGVAADEEMEATTDIIY